MAEKLVACGIDNCLLCPKIDKCTNDSYNPRQWNHDCNKSQCLKCGGICVNCDIANETNKIMRPKYIN